MAPVHHHRATGVALYFGTLLLAWWLIAAACQPHLRQRAGFGGDYRKAVVWLTSALMHRLLSGLRHLVLDLGYSFKADEHEALTWGALISGISLTVLVWIAAYAIGGGR